MKFLTYGMLSVLLIASSCKRQDNEVLPNEDTQTGEQQQVSQEFKNPLSAVPTDQELLQLASSMMKTPVKRKLTADGDELLQRDMTPYLKATVLSKNQVSSNDHGHDHKDAQLEIALNRAHPSVKTVQKYFNEAAAEFNVPVELLMAIGQVQSNWTQVSESMYGSWGIMGLIENKFIQQITQAAGILKVSPQQIKDDAKTNIRAAAALLAKYQKNQSANSLDDWFEATKEVTGLQVPLYKEQLAQRFFELINKGSKSVTLWGEIINIPAVNVNISHKLQEAGNKQQANQSDVKGGGATVQAVPSSAAVSAVDYPGAVESLTTCNYSSRNGAPIEYYFVHYIATGTYQGAINWFHNCSSQVSAHYVVRNSDGQVTQVVREIDRAWSQGVALYNDRGIGTEHEVLASNLAMWYSDPMMTSAGKLAANVCDRRAIPKVRKVALPGINGHSDVKATSCPNMTQAVWDLFMSKVNPPTGVFDNFESGVGRFNSAPTASGSTVGIATTSTLTQSSGAAHGGTYTLKAVLNDNTSSTAAWTVRLLSGGGTAANNVLLPKTGYIRFWMKTSTAQAGATVKVWVDDSDGTEASSAKSVINDGAWHEYVWSLSNFGGTAVTGNGAITATNVTLDAIVLNQANTSAQWIAYIDDVGK
ncbi:MAG TPA: N-acetylmuramoyl-L-alanine amidase [Sphingobacteriaceae bacterium]|nr:N-acetylmuramoyl-L-alanine amidase [Sphingobacteriaceae bacterium]